MAPAAAPRSGPQRLPIDSAREFRFVCYLRAPGSTRPDWNRHLSTAGMSSSIIAPHLTATVRWASVGIFAVLAIATAGASTLASWRPQRDYSELLARIWTWWLMIGVF